MTFLDASVSATAGIIKGAALSLINSKLFERRLLIGARSGEKDWNLQQEKSRGDQTAPTEGSVVLGGGQRAPHIHDSRRLNVPMEGNLRKIKSIIVRVQTQRRRRIIPQNKRIRGQHPLHPSNHRSSP